MRPSPELLRQLPDLDVLSEQLEERHRSDIMFERAFAAPMHKEAAIIHAEGGGAGVSPSELRRLRERILDKGREGVRKIRKDGENADLDAGEHQGLEAIVLITHRPAILIQDGAFLPPPETWQGLEDHREAIQSVIGSVGRIEVAGHPSMDWVGTGFLVADDVIMTNRHVAAQFVRPGGDRAEWTFTPGVRGRIDYREELGSVEPAEFELVGVVGMHEELDLALLRVERSAGKGVPSPDPLTVASEPPRTSSGRRIYTTGYPALDSRRNDPEVMRRIFSNVFDIKRLLPGEIMEIVDERNEFLHDCSTLGGNSGSCVVDLETHQVIGLHFGGRYLEGNQAVALWKLTGDPLLKKAKVHYA